MAKEIKMTNIPLEEIIRRQESVVKAHQIAKLSNQGPRLQPMPKSMKK
jgi:hypothetical protein